MRICGTFLTPKILDVKLDVELQSHVQLLTLAMCVLLCDIVRLVLQFTVEASDQRANSRVGVAGVTIVIARDQQPPHFNGEPFRVVVSENKPVNETVLSVTASDPDIQVCMAHLYYNSPNICLSLFAVCTSQFLLDCLGRYLKLFLSVTRFHLSSA